jgi:2-polyprenyl-3-methyl-5-hydroxy-6-metoxy-1,4-benzoquinol methylase
LKQQPFIQRDETGHIIPKETAGYNERLFKQGFRKKFHEARFHWLRRQFENYKISAGSVLELGCFDGRSIDCLPFVPYEYRGYDANWEQGLDTARVNRAQQKQFSFIESKTVADFDPPKKHFDFAICLETLEHLPEEQLHQYLQKFQQATNHLFFVTVPVELGLMALMKYQYKKIFLAVDEPYSTTELWYMLWANLQKVKRVPLGHKGFDYRKLKKIVQQYFHIEKETTIPFSKLPAVLNSSCAWVLRPIHQ